MIKKLLTTYLLILSSQCSIAQMQLGQFDVSGGIGAISIQEIINQLGGDKAPETFNSATTIYSISGKYFVSDWVGLGLGLGTQTFAGYSQHYYNSNPNPYTFTQHLVCIAPAITGIYIKRQWFQFYSVYSLGLYVSNEIETYDDGSKHRVSSVIPAEQITPLAFRFGGKVAGYIELGFGYKGLINAGISCSIGKSHPFNYHHFNPYRPRGPHFHSKKTYSP